MKKYFIIGTDTDCGKTHVTTKLIQYLSEKQNKVIALKPVASGCHEKNGYLLSDDAIALQCFSNKETDLKDICPWPLRKFISPHLAALSDNVQLSAQEIASFCLNSKLESADYVLIEGAGGLIVPLNDTETWIDVIKLTNIPVIMVVGMRLGCINHSLLTFSVLRTNNISCIGWIANCIDKDMLYLNENIATIANKIDSPLLGIVPYGGDIKIMKEFNF